MSDKTQYPTGRTRVRIEQREHRELMLSGASLRNDILNSTWVPSFILVLMMIFTPLTDVTMVGRPCRELQGASSRAQEGDVSSYSPLQVPSPLRQTIGEPSGEPSASSGQTCRIVDVAILHQCMSCDGLKITTLVSVSDKACSAIRAS